jgi:hypothetical protein
MIYYPHPPQQYREWNDMIMMTTLLHLFAMSSALPVYSTLIATSTALSILWHKHNEKSAPLLFADYVVAVLWFATDAGLDWRTIPLNLAVAAAHATMENHAAWHCLSAAKAVVVSHYLLTG